MRIVVSCLKVLTFMFLGFEVAIESSCCWANKSGEMPCDWSSKDKKKFLTEVKNFYWDDIYLFKYCFDKNFQRCIPDDEFNFVILKHTVAIFLQKRQLQKYCSMDFIDLHYLKIHMHSGKCVRIVK
ncbi:uncharacterized protein LOC102626240 isoform X2 [Citrus sinensis]|uniref:uncharacterized protein LOC102626240 isoform X2 n=1 Tax=Citrus sinensis TaxID=2711 RepID=UPI002278C011|nr:uncharacterized protein LOC102626240 isoform X2 [Citrus sinensis]